MVHDSYLQTEQFGQVPAVQVPSTFADFQHTPAPGVGVPDATGTVDVVAKPNGTQVPGVPAAVHTHPIAEPDSGFPFHTTSPLLQAPVAGAAVMRVASNPNSLHCGASHFTVAGLTEVEALAAIVKLCVSKFTAVIEVSSLPPPAPAPAIWMQSPGR